MDGRLLVGMNWSGQTRPNPAKAVYWYVSRHDFQRTISGRSHPLAADIRDFAFQLLLAYLVDLIPLALAFTVAAAVSLALVGGYLRAAAGKTFARIAVPAQFIYLVLFSYSFFFDGLTGLTITVGAVVTLASDDPNRQGRLGHEVRWRTSSPNSIEKENKPGDFTSPGLSRLLNLPAMAPARSALGALNTRRGPGSANGWRWRSRRVRPAVPRPGELPPRCPHL